MHFGIALPGRGPLATPDRLARLAEKAEALGYASAFVSDHVVIPVAYESPYPYTTTGKFAADWTNGYLEPLALLGFLAGLTSRIRLGSSVLIVPYRNPVVTAKTLATLDVASGGRLILGVGVGWLREEFEALAAPAYAARGRVTDEYLRLMRACWTREPAEFQGEHYRLPPVSAMPKPRQRGGIPLWAGGHTAAALRRAGEVCDGWHPIGMRAPAMLYPQEYAGMAAAVRGWAEKAGREPGEITLSFRVPLELLPRRAKPPGGDRVLFRGTADQVLEDIGAYGALGVSHLVFDLTPPTLPGALALLERFAQDVRPRAGARGAARTTREARRSRSRSAAR